MKLLFVHETKFKEDNDGNLYTGGSYSMDIWERYLCLTSDFRVIGRKETNVYSSEYSRSKFNFFEKDKIKFIEVPELYSSTVDYIKRRNIKNITTIIKRQILEVDCLVVRLPSVYGYIAIDLSKKMGKPYLVEIVGCAKDALWYHSWKGKILSFINYNKMKKSIIDSPYNIYVTKNYLQMRYPTLGHSTNCSNVMLDDAGSEILEKRLNKIESMSLASTIIIGTVGGIDISYKGQRYVIEALGRLKKNGISNFEYELVGSGDNSKLKKLSEKYDIADKIRFLGTMPKNNVMEWMDTIDLYIQPSSTEGLPRAVIEAMSRGCPVIGSRVGGIPELLEKESCFKKKSVKDLQKILESINFETMKKDAERNFKESQRYKKDVIETRRRDFLIKFIDSK